MLAADRAVLVADDNEDDRFLMAEACRETGIANRLCVVCDGEEVIEYLSGAGRFADRTENPLPGLVILDIKMPKKNGFEALRWIRENPAFKSLPVIMLSASSYPKDIDEAYRSGAVAFLVKPSSQEGLVALVGSIREFWLRFTEYPPA